MRYRILAYVLLLIVAVGYIHHRKMDTWRKIDGNHETRGSSNRNR